MTPRKIRCASQKYAEPLSGIRKNAETATNAQMSVVDPRRHHSGSRRKGRTRLKHARDQHDEGRDAETLVDPLLRWDETDRPGDDAPPRPGLYLAVVAEVVLELPRRPGSSRSERCSSLLQRACWWSCGLARRLWG